MKTALNIAVGGALLGTAAAVIVYRRNRTPSLAKRARRLGKQLDKSARHLAVAAEHALSSAGDSIRDEGQALSKGIRRSAKDGHLRQIIDRPTPLVLGALGALATFWGRSRRGTAGQAASLVGLGLLAAAGNQVEAGGSPSWFRALLAR